MPFPLGLHSEGMREAGEGINPPRLALYASRSFIPVGCERRVAQKKALELGDFTIDT